jgi:hypothetical protein
MARKKPRRKAKKTSRKPRVNVIVDGNWKDMCKSKSNEKRDGVSFGLFLVIIAAIFYYGFRWEYALGAFGLMIILGSLFKKK